MRCSEGPPGLFEALAPSANEQWAAEFTWERAGARQAGWFLPGVHTDMKLSRRRILIKEIPQNTFLLSIRPRTNTKTGKFASTGSFGSLSFLVSTRLLTDTAHTSWS